MDEKNNARRAMFKAFSECLANGNDMLPNEIADHLLAAATQASSAPGGEAVDEVKAAAPTATSVAGAGDERCACGTHTKDACDKFGACLGVATATSMETKGAPSAGIKTWQERIKAHLPLSTENRAAVKSECMRAEIADLRAALAAAQAPAAKAYGFAIEYVDGTTALFKGNPVGIEPVKSGVVVSLYTAPVAEKAEPVTKGRDNLLADALNAVSAWVDVEVMHTRNVGKGGPGDGPRCERAEREAFATIRKLYTAPVAQADKEGK